MAASRKDDARELILQTTKALLKDQPLSDVSLARIAETAGVSKGTIYYYFKTKEDILFAVLDEYLKKQWDELVLWTEDPQKDTSLPRLIKYVVERDLAASNLRLQFFYDAMTGNEEVRKKLLQRYRDFAALIAEKIRERTDRVSADYLSWLLLLAADGLLLHQSIGNSDVNAKDLIDRTQEYLKKVF